MKKIFTLVAATMMAAGAFAQTESAFIDTEATFTAAEAVAIAGGTVVCESANVTMSQAWDDTYKKVAMCGEADLVNSVTIDGVEYAMPAGIQAQTNPNPNSLSNGGQQSGAVFKFNVKVDGVLYVFGKMTYNKNYYVWEGDVAMATASPVAYTFSAAQVKAGQGDDNVSYTIPGDEMGYYVIGSGYDDGAKYMNAAQCVEVAAKGDPAALTHWTSGNALGVIAFPVYAEPGEYYVNACGSKITSNGFVFVPGATEIGAISFSKSEGAGINNIAATTINSNVAYNLAGQRVAANAKGIKIINGKKVIK